MFWFNLLISGGLFVLLLGLGPLYGWLEQQPIVGWLLIAYGGKLLFQNVYAIPFALLRKELRFAEIAKARIDRAPRRESIARIVFACARRDGLVLDARRADPCVRVRRDHADPAPVRAEAGVPAARGDRRT